MRILLVEDERDMASWLMRALAQSGFVPDHAADARTAEAFMAGTEYDAIVMDLRLPDKHGLVAVSYTHLDVYKRQVAGPARLISRP